MLTTVTFAPSTIWSLSDDTRPPFVHRREYGCRNSGLTPAARQGSRSREAGQDQKHEVRGQSRNVVGQGKELPQETGVHGCARILGGGVLAVGEQGRERRRRDV